MVSIMPGIESRAPERTETRSGSRRSPKRLPTSFSMRRRPSFICLPSFSGKRRPLS
jgi:hypothetical protein